MKAPTTPGRAGSRTMRWLAALTAFLLIAPSALTAPTATGQDANGSAFQLVSTASSGGAGNAASIWPSVSDNGRRLVFNSFADDLAPGGNGGTDVFFRQRVAGSVARIADGACFATYTGVDPASASGSAGFDAISGDGRYVAFTSGCALIEGDTNGALDVYVADVETGLLELVSVGDDGTPGNANSFGASISTDGRHVGFTSAADNLVVGDTNGTTDVFVHDLGPRTTSLVSVATDGSRVEPGRFAEGGSVSADGRYVAFHSDSRDLLADPSEATGDLHAFVHDRVQGVTTAVSVDTRGVPDTGTHPKVSADGSVVVFTSDEALVDDDTNALNDVYVFDRVAGSLAGRVSVAPDGAAADGSSASFDVSADGRFVVFASVASNLAPVTSSGPHVFLRDRTAGRSVLVAEDGDSPSVTADGTVVAFSSGSQLDPEDANGHDDVYVWLDCSRAPSLCGDADGARLHGSVFDGARGRPDLEPLIGVKVELRQGDRVVHGPVATRAADILSGEEGPAFYEFEGVTPGRYRLRVTLEDTINDPPIFDVRHGDGAKGPAWAEFHVEVAADQADLERDVHFSNVERVAFVTPDLGGHSHRLDDLAVVFRHLTDYVGWVKSELPGVEFGTTSRPLPVEVHAWSAAAERLTSPFYRPSSTSIHMPSDLSLRTQRAPKGGPWPGPTVEWHEFTHHLWYTNISSPECVLNRNHGGYANIDTCDSLSEGLAAFLPTMAAQELLPTSQRPGSLGQYDAFNGIALESNRLDAWGRVRIRFGGRSGAVWREEFAVAALLWDLVDETHDFDNDTIPLTGVAGVEKLPVRDVVEIELGTLWRVLTDMPVATVRDLWEELHRSSHIVAALKEPLMHVSGGAPGEKDNLTSLDIPFLMHGFYPVNGGRDVAVSVNQLSAKYGDVHDAIGRTDSPDPATGSLRDRRFFTDRVPGARVRLSVRDPDGRPFPQVTATLTFAYPEGTRTVELDLEDDGTTDVYLEPPPYFAGLADEDGDLPACSESDYRVTIGISVAHDGVAATDSVELDNCTYLQAVAATTGVVAVEHTLTIPEAAPVTGRDTGDACPAERVPEDGLEDAERSVHEPAVDCLVWWAITAGRTSTTYQPAARVTRAQLATFLARVLEATGVPLPDQPTDRFADDGDSVHHLAINQLAELGLVRGVAAGRFGPNVAVDRQQMATFLANAYARVAGSALGAPVDHFTDDAGSVHHVSINGVAQAGIAAGTGADRYDPTGVVTRGQMASFLVRLLDLLTEQGHGVLPS